MSSITVRPAAMDDAFAVCDVLRRSITELCHADHNGDESSLEQWLANKTPAHVRSWMENPANCIVVACKGSVLAGVGAVTSAGLITLNYVAPEFRFRGVSKAVLHRLEDEIMRQGHAACNLFSTITAHAFYLRSGYVDVRSMPEDRGQRMRKQIIAKSVS